MLRLARYFSVRLYISARAGSCSGQRDREREQLFGDACSECPGSVQRHHAAGRRLDDRRSRPAARVGL